MSQFKFYFTSSMLNTFLDINTSIIMNCDFSIVEPRWSCVLVSMCVGVSVWVVGVVSVLQADALACHCGRRTASCSNSVDITAADVMSAAVTVDMTAFKLSLFNKHWILTS